MEQHGSAQSGGGDQPALPPVPQRACQPEGRARKGCEHAVVEPEEPCTKDPQTKHVLYVGGSAVGYRFVGAEAEVEDVFDERETEADHRAIDYTVEHVVELAPEGEEEDHEDD